MTADREYAELKQCGWCAQFGHTTDEHAAEKDAGRPSSFLRFDGMTWPNPADPREVQHRLRHGQPSKADLLVAAAFMHAYAHLIEMPQRERNQRVSQIKASTPDGGSDV